MKINYENENNEKKKLKMKSILQQLQKKLLIKD